MIDRRIKFRHIQCFVEIEQERSLKLAADKLNLTQPAISKTLKELEDIIGASLMTRNRAGIVLTKQGKVYRANASKFALETEALLFPTEGGSLYSSIWIPTSRNLANQLQGMKSQFTLGLFLEK